MDLPETPNASSCMKGKSPQSSVHYFPRVTRLSSDCVLPKPAHYGEDLCLSNHCHCWFRSFILKRLKQRARKVVSDSPGLVDFAIGLVNSVLNLPDGQGKIFRRIKITKVV